MVMVRVMVRFKVWVMRECPGGEMSRRGMSDMRSAVTKDLVVKAEAKDF